MDGRPPGCSRWRFRVLPMSTQAGYLPGGGRQAGGSIHGTPVRNTGSPSNLTQVHQQEKVYRMATRSIYRKILIAFDNDLLNRIDRERRLQKLDRTKFIRKAVKAYVVSEEFRRASGERSED
jgi:hypothetical protein